MAIGCACVCVGLIVGCPATTPPPPDGGDGGGGGGDAIPAGFTNADGINGGRLYDKFWSTEGGFDQDDPNIATLDAFGDFFRCKQCHAWDRRANMASYINRAPSTTRPNVSGLELVERSIEHSAQELFDGIKNGDGAPRRSIDADLSTYDPADPSTTTVGDQMPNYGEILTDEQIWDLVKYLKEEALDTTQLYEVTTEGTYPTGSRTFSNFGEGGDAANGDALYARCAGCHGDNGIGGGFPIDEGAFSVGSFLRSKPYELWHKVKFGQLGSVVMDAQGIDTLEDMRDLYAALADETKYPDPPGNGQ
jgi:mono/diheme cytochrome c family protein